MQQPTEPIPIDPSLVETSRPPSTASSAARIPPQFLSSSVTLSSIRGASSPHTRSISDWGSTTTEEAEFLRNRVQQLEANIDEQDRKVAYLEHKLERQGAILKRLLQDVGWDADEEGDAFLPDCGQRAKKRPTKVPTVNKILTQGDVSKLTEKQRKVRKELLAFASDKLRTLSGTPKKSNLPPAGFLPGKNVLPDGRTVLIPDFTEDVTTGNNAQIIEQVAELVYKEQSNEATCDLRHRNIAFTDKDVEELAKIAFKNWKAAYERETNDTKASKAAQTKKRTTRTQRKRQKKLDRLEVKEEYLYRHTCDPAPLLLTDWMSDYVSDLEEGTEEEKIFHRGRLAAEAGLTNISHTSREIIWERVRPGFQSDEANEVYKRLDDLIDEHKRDSGRKKTSVKRVDLRRVNNRIPSVPPFPFMVSETWRHEFVDEKQLSAPFVTRREDPPGFGTKKSMQDGEFDEFE